MCLRWRKGKSKELNVSTPCLPWIAKTSKASRSDHFFRCLVILSKLEPYFGTISRPNLVWEKADLSPPISTRKMYLKTHEKRSHSRPRPALVFNRKSADQVLASQGKTVLNWFATDCWSKKNLICRAMEPSPIPGQFLHLHDSRPAIVRNSMHCEHVVSMSWSEVWSIQRTLLVQHISTLQLQISKSPKKNLAANPFLMS